jgi:single-stranded-DNA-specific exonuclease
MPAYRWEIAPALTPSAQAALGEFHPLMAQVLANRGVADRVSALSFLSHGEGPTYDPFQLPDMQAAVDRLLLAIQRREKVAVYGDFDADGITGTALLVQGLRRLGAIALPYIPHRETEGYGINTGALDKLWDKEARVVVSVDTGTSAVEEIDHAWALGFDAIVLDHHAIPPVLPRALAVVNPHRAESRYPFDGLAGVGVGFKLLQAMYLATGRSPEAAEEYLDLAAIGTVADLAPLTHENRWMVQQGLAAINSGARPGLKALARTAGLQPGAIDAGDLGFMVAPRLNAMGRLDHAFRSYKLLCSTDGTEVSALADVLEATNKERQQVTRAAVEAARAAADPEDGPLVMVAGPYPAGVIGLVASRLAEERYRPSVVVEQGEEFSRGSCRSIPQVSIVDALAECRDLFVRYGGHPAAAGFTIRTERLPELRVRLTEAVERALQGGRPGPVLRIDAETPLRAFPGSLMQELGRLAPFGQANSQPVFVTRQLAVVQKRTLGATGDHLELRLKEQGVTWRAMGFGMGGRIAEVPDTLDLAYTISPDRYYGGGALQLRIRDWRPPGEGAV